MSIHEPCTSNVLKVCTHCKTAKHPLCFAANKSTSDGLQVWCRECVRVESPTFPSKILTRGGTGKRADVRVSHVKFKYGYV